MTQAQAEPSSHPAAASVWDNLPRRARGLSLRTLIILRWLAIVGQTATVLVALLLLHFPMPVWECLAIIAASVAVNLWAMARLRRTPGQPPDGRQTALHLGWDILQLSALLALTGGLENPFCILLVAPVTVAAASLPGRQAILLGLLVLLAAGTLFYWSLPLPWAAGTELELPGLYRFGLGLGLVTGVVFTSAWAWRVAADAEKLELALATTQDVLQREQRLAALGGLAAAAAHELGTPLATIQVVAKEMLRGTSPDTPQGEDARLLLTQAERCRDILRRLSQAPEDGDALYLDVGLRALLNEVVEPHLGVDLTIDCEVVADGPEPRVRRLPEVVHGLSTLVENAADFAAGRVRVRAWADAATIRIEVLDDGPGFAPDILPRLGEPYVTSRPLGKAGRLAGRTGGARTPIAIPSQGGMGLGFFIARTLMERSGGQLSVGPGDGGPGGNRGARVTTVWPRRALEAVVDPGPIPAMT